MNNNLEVNSYPTKQFFLNMITKDVSVESSIMDLIDNSIDSYKKNSKTLKECNIDIGFDIDGDYFFINDNCGGMSKEIAKTKAFVFGNFEERDSSALGMYGIGMKRSIFKIGDDFNVYSRTKDDSYKVYMEKSEWLDLKDDNKNDIWRFHIEDVKNDFADGVHIYITKLSPSFKKYIESEKCITDLKKQISDSYGEMLTQGVHIKVNEEEIIFAPGFLFESDELNIKTYIKTYDLQKCRVRIIAGIGEASPKDAGWNIIANGRGIIEKDRSEMTGWDTNYNPEDDEDVVDDILKNKHMPAYHNDFARFRGYIFIDSEDASNLPLNTTKDGIDKQHPVYIFVLNEMINALKRILPALRLLQVSIRNSKKEMTQSPTTLFYKTSVFELHKISEQKFSMNLSAFKAKDTIKTIPVYLSSKKTEQLKEYFNVRQNKELGEALLAFVTERIILEDE